MKVIIIIVISVLIVFLVVFLIKKFFKIKNIKINLFKGIGGFFGESSKSYASFISRGEGKKIGLKLGETKEENKKSEIKEKAREFKKSHVSLDKEYHERKQDKENLGKKKLKERKVEESKTTKPFRISSLDEALKKINDKELVEILKYLEKEGYDVKKEILNKKFDSAKELRDFLKEILVSFLMNKYEALKEKISLLRKSGRDVEYEWLKLMMVPSKIEIFKSTLARKDFNKVMELIDSLEKELKKYEEDLKR